MPLGPTIPHSPVTAPRTRRNTLYLLRDTGPSPADLRTALNARYEHDHSFAVEDTTVGHAPALLCHGVIGHHRPPDWTSAVHTLTGRKPPVENRSSACVMLLPVADDVFALTFGMGHILLGQSRISPGFGFDFALRAATARRHPPGHAQPDGRGRTDRSSAAQGQHTRAFPIEEYGEVVSRLVGTLSSTELTIGKHATAQVAGTDALKIHLGAQPEDLLRDLMQIRAVLARRSPVPEFESDPSAASSLLRRSATFWSCSMASRPAGAWKPCPRATYSHDALRTCPVRASTVRYVRRTYRAQRT